MNAAVVKRTQDTLGKVIKKPPLTEKLLNKPPFRYLHDIFSEVIRSTGFLKGLYEENEMKSDSVKEKDSKIIFLQKAIDVVMLVTGEPLAAKPARIVAGHEPEKTNELLQAIGKCCLNKLSSDEAVKRVLAGEKVDLKTKAGTSKSQSKEDREGRKHTQNNEERKKTTERSSSEDQKDADRPQRLESQNRDENKEHQRDRRRSDRHHRGEQEHPAKGHDKSRDREQDKGHARDRNKDRDRDREKIRGRDSHRDKEKQRDKHRERQKDEVERNTSAESRNDKAREADDLQQKADSEEQSNKSAITVPAFENPTRIPRPSSAKGQRRRPKMGGPDDSDSEGDGDVHVAQRGVPQENGGSGGSSAQLDTTSRLAARPSSARPAPPRVKRQESHADVTPTERLSSAKTPAPVIMDGKALSEDEDEQFLVEEAVPPPSDAPVIDREAVRELDSEENHGGLVKKILETQKNYESSLSSSKSAEKNLVSEAALNKEREVVKDEVERLNSFVQEVCSESHMLGKIMDYIQEDVDAVQTELHTWRRENKEHAQSLLQEQRATDQTMETLKANLAELEQQIKDQQDKICAVKSNIMKNEEKIQKMVTGISISSRS
uniref:TRAF3-interacting protein 1 n=1 Tax=Iconisemion striatum TaxID=60296 RepID=A0A1A7X679_9TELE